MSKNSKCTDSNCNDYCTEVGCGFTCYTGCTGCSSNCGDPNCYSSCGTIAESNGINCGVCRDKCTDGCTGSCNGTCYAITGRYACWGTCIGAGCTDVACQGGCEQKRKWSTKPHFLFIFHYFQNRHHDFYL